MVRIVINEQHVHVVSRDVIHVYSPTKAPDRMFFQLQRIAAMLPNVVISGLPSVVRAVINEDEKKQGHYNLLVEGTGLLDVASCVGVVGTTTTTNNVIEAFETLGVEAARTLIIEQILFTMHGHGLDLDHRHVQLLADLMTFRGQVLGITRHGLVRMKQSVLALASFEKTVEQLLKPRSKATSIRFAVCQKTSF
eukprot:GABV01002358.1.p1 GENE.GABV01002358.1~~GABV01002358.1.p1  ORF type:complete len:194 (+),score=62.15 GABV01002358.1:35-616(+)